MMQGTGTYVGSAQPTLVSMLKHQQCLDPAPRKEVRIRQNNPESRYTDCNSPVIPCLRPTLTALKNPLHAKGK